MMMHRSVSYMLSITRYINDRPIVGALPAMYVSNPQVKAIICRLQTQTCESEHAE